jgi:hypothetical protein
MGALWWPKRGRISCPTPLRVGGKTPLVDYELWDRAQGTQVNELAIPLVRICRRRINQRREVADTADCVTRKQVSNVHAQIEPLVGGPGRTGRIRKTAIVEVEPVNVVICARSCCTCHIHPELYTAEAAPKGGLAPCRPSSRGCMNILPNGSKQRRQQMRWREQKPGIISRQPVDSSRTSKTESRKPGTQNLLPSPILNPRRGTIVGTIWRRCGLRRSFVPNRLPPASPHRNTRVGAVPIRGEWEWRPRKAPQRGGAAVRRPKRTEVAYLRF